MGIPLSDFTNIFAFVKVYTRGKHFQCHLRFIPVMCTFLCHPRSTENRRNSHENLENLAEIYLDREISGPFAKDNFGPWRSRELIPVKRSSS